MGLRYSEAVKKNQERDKAEGSAKSKFQLPKSYVDNKEPVTQAGVSKGLSVVLDAHTDLLASGSVAEDFQVLAKLLLLPHSQFIIEKVLSHYRRETTYTLCH